MVKKDDTAAKKKLQKALQKRYDEVQESSEEKVEVKQGKPWTKTGVFNSYESATKHRDFIKEKFPEFDTKIKRCGHRQSKFKVLKRKNKELAKKAKE